MSEMPISYTEAMRRFPVQVKEALADLRKGKSKDKGMPPKDMKWGYGWGVEIRGYHFKQLIDGTAQADRVKDEAMTLDEAVADEVSRTKLGLWCKAGRGFGRSSNMPVPEELVAEIRKRHEAARSQKEENAKLTPEERHKKIQELLGQLPGVTAVSVPVEPDKTQQIKGFFAKQHEADKDYLKGMLANIPSNVPKWAVDAVRNKLSDMEKGGAPQVVVEEGKTTKHTVEELASADDDKLDQLAAQYAAHARNKLKRR
jgi:hypothetical protein